VDERLATTSKRLARVLRHDPGSAGLVLDVQGWVPVVDVLAALDLTRDQLDAVVAGNEKQRFAVMRGEDGVERIRASQGHSVPIDLGLTAVTPPAVLYHGTPVENLPSILAEGLHRGRRHHVHLSVDTRTAHIVGSRQRRRDVILIVDAAAMAAAGYSFYRSANGVWLTERVPQEYLAVSPDRR
jgi:putative RNA 2'-phosphotransferase